MSSETTYVKSFIAGGVGGFCMVIIGQPFDMIKVRLQTMPVSKTGGSPLYKSTVDCLAKIVKREGLFSLYKGMAAPLLSVVPIFALSFFGFNLGKKLQATDENKPLTKPQILAAGMLGGAFGTLVLTPCDRLKCILQIQGGVLQHALYRGPMCVVRKLYQEGGIRNIYRGIPATLLREVPGSGTDYSVYIWLREALKPVNADESSLGVGRTLAAGGIAGVCAWLVCIGPDTLKTRLQTAPEGKYPQGIRSVFKEMLQNESIFSLYKGISPALMRTLFGNATCYLGYELTIRLMNNLEEIELSI